MGNLVRLKLFLEMKAKTLVNVSIFQMTSSNGDAIISHIFADVSRKILFFLRIYANDIIIFFVIKYNLLPLK